jgi:hypothetical protein
MPKSQAKNQICQTPQLEKPGRRVFNQDGLNQGLTSWIDPDHLRLRLRARLSPASEVPLLSPSCWSRIVVRCGVTFGIELSATDRSPPYRRRWSVSLRPTTPRFASRTFVPDIFPDLFVRAFKSLRG